MFSKVVPQKKLINKIMPLPKDILEIRDLYKQNGYSLYVVGGSVRDFLMSKPVHDYDLATDAPVSFSQNFFKHGVYNNHKYFVMDIKGCAEHGVTFVQYNGTQYEIAEFRTDKQSIDHRHANVSLGASLEEDLLRRDFTINALAYDISNNQIIDVLGGACVSDIKNGVLRAVGDSYARFTEDALRILRALRFSATFGFTMDSTLSEGIQKVLDNSPELFTVLSAERKVSEFNKIFSKDTKGISVFKLLFSYKSANGTLFDMLFPNISQSEDFTANLSLFLHEHELLCRSGCREPLYHWALFCLLFGFSKSSSQKLANFLSAMHFSKSDRTLVLKLYESFGHNLKFKNTDYSMRLYVSQVGKTATKKIIDFWTYLSASDVEMLNVLNRWKAFLQTDFPYRVCDLAINGSDIIALGFKGIHIGEALNCCLNEVLKNPENNNKVYLVNFLVSNGR